MSQSFPYNITTSRENSTHVSRRYTGVSGSAKGWVINVLHKSFHKIAIICKDNKSAESLLSDLKFFLKPTNPSYFGGWDSLPFENVSPQISISAERLQTLNRCLSTSSYVIVTTGEALLQKTLPKKVLKGLGFHLDEGVDYSPSSLLDKLLSLGFNKVSLVEEVGDVAIRGAVLDFYPSTVDLPIRVQFLDNKIIGLRTFSAETQRSTPEEGKLGQIDILPVRELLPFSTLNELSSDTSIERIRQRGQQLETPLREVTRAIEQLRLDPFSPGSEILQSIALKNQETFLDYLDAETMIVINDQLGIESAIERFYQLVSEREERLTKDHYLIPSKETLYLSPKDIFKGLETKIVTYIDHLEVSTSSEEVVNGVANLNSISNIELKTRLKTKVGSGNAYAYLGNILGRWGREKYNICFVIGSKPRKARLQQILLDLGFDAEIFDHSASEWTESRHLYPIAILSGHLSEGVILPNERIVFISENEVFTERSYRKSSRKTNIKRLLSSLAQLSEDDYIVHVDYGIGIYRGLKHLEVEGAESDFLQIDYADSRLYLPVQNIDRVQKFMAAEGQKPIIDKLSSNRWIKTKAKVTASVVELAGDLIKLYASRSVLKGWTYDPSGAEDERFADDFPYDETPDQLKAIEETLLDMGSDKPMDRLICGDVGFGKTEVAIRGAFKALQHAKQVAVLVPTTILVEQHKTNFQSRFRDYPATIEAVSRFYKPEQNRKTLEGVAAGNIDIIIGTHRLLQKDVAFKDLGLLIIDEEHRFGVRQKEKLKALRKQVDILTLTATPIPRTLHMSLLGIRDISIINTPPQDRRMIRTYTAVYDETIIRDAILRELGRGGQCFFVHNRVQSISLVTSELARLVPEARFHFGHGQMEEKQLERIMKQFMDGEIDVLVTTTIIESGLDIPNANTIIVDRADAFGLAQLYQLRGRVGRSDKQAYAYLLVPKSMKLGSEAQKRLKVLQALDDLGLGFNLAIRDMEIRGVGNLLGKEQSGYVVAVGYELYCKILKEAVLNLKGEELSLDETIDPEMKLALSAYIPGYYVPDIADRLVLYQRLSGIRSQNEVDLLAEEIEDRFGPIPGETKNLVEMMRLRSVLRAHGVVKAEFSPKKYTLSFSSRAPIDGDKVVALIKKDPKSVRFSKNLTLSIHFSEKRIEEAHEIYETVNALLLAIAR